MKFVRLWLCLLAASMLIAQDNTSDLGPATLVITYRCVPSQRIKLRQHMRDDGLHRFEDWRRNTILQNYRILFSRYVDTNNWDMMMILTFAHYSDFDKWQRVERDTPAGLPATVLDQLLYVNTYPVDLVRQKISEERPLHPAYLVVPYARSVTFQEYLDYWDRTVRPQVEGWMAKGVLTRYDLLTQRYGAARPWDGLLILEYKDDASMSAQVLAQTGQHTATEREAVIADEMVLSR